MKTTLLCILLMLTGILSAQIVENPPFKARSGSIRNITRIERTPENTRVYVHAIFRPHWWIKEGGNNFLEDAATGKKYAFKSAEGIEINKEVYMPDSGEKDYVLVFEPLPKETQVIHLIDPTSLEGSTFDISLAPQKKKKISLLEKIKGNWYRADATSSWEYGIYDSITIMHNRVYTNESIRKKGKRIEVTVKDKQNGSTSTLLLTPQKDGTCQIQINGVNEYLYTKERGATQAVISDTGFQNFFRRDTAYIQGYIDGYDPRLRFDTGLIYLSNELTREDYPTVIQIDKDGSFNCKFVINHPVEQSVTLGNNRIPFFIEPGQTLTMYIDWEAIMERSRARDYYYPIKNLAYMGPSAPFSYLLDKVDKKISYKFEEISNAQKTLTPNQFKEQVQPTIAQWEQAVDSLTRIWKPSAKAVRLIKNKKSLKEGYVLFSFLMSRDYYARQDTTNQVLKVKEDDSYYDFLKRMPLNDETVLADDNGSVFINRFEYMDAFNKTYSIYTSRSTDSITYTYSRMPLLTFLKERGVKLNADQEAIRLENEKLAGTMVKTTLGQVWANNDKLKDLLKSEEKLVAEYFKIYSPKDPSLLEEDKSYIASEQKVQQMKDSIIARLCNDPTPLLWQIAKVRSLNYHLKNIKTRTVAREYVDSIKQRFTVPILVTEAEGQFDKAHPETAVKSYQLPEGKATEIFRNITKNHPGKVLFVDFWATTCGPCRGGIEATAHLRQQYKNHPEFQFIYITGAKDSPEDAYKNYVEKNLKGEACYYVTETEFNYLRQLFRFNGIPHYELVEKDGSISYEDLSSHSIEKHLEKRFATSGSDVQAQNAQ